MDFHSRSTEPVDEYVDLIEDSYRLIASPVKVAREVEEHLMPTPDGAIVVRFEEKHPRHVVVAAVQIVSGIGNAHGVKQQALGTRDVGESEALFAETSFTHLPLEFGKPRRREASA